jgi:hypothetical protein
MCSVMVWPVEITLSGIYFNTTVCVGFTTVIIDKCSLFGGSHYHSREGEGGYVFEIWTGKEREGGPVLLCKLLILRKGQWVRLG